MGTRTSKRFFRLLVPVRVGHPQYPQKQSGLTHLDVTDEHHVYRVDVLRRVTYAATFGLGKLGQRQPVEPRSVSSVIGHRPFIHVLRQSLTARPERRCGTRR